MGETKFFGSQVGSRSVLSYSYTDSPWRLLAYDLYNFCKYAWALPYILLPLTPADSGDLDELSPTLGNVFCIVLHAILFAVQAGFILIWLPLALLVPAWVAGLGTGVFLLVNHLLCLLLNGPHNETVFHSDPKFAADVPEHSHEQWIFLNGVAVGSHWLQCNLNRLAVTFKRPILGIHNRTNGIPFDILECLVQRNLSYATSDIRMCYKIIKEKLYNPQYSKVVFILHSQGGIEGGLVLDWLLQELPQDQLAKLEIYTFGNAANHFNNPHRHLSSEAVAHNHPLAASVDATPRPSQNGNGTASPAAPPVPAPSSSALSSETTASNPSSVSDRAVGHIEHYAHTTDFVARWGVLHFATSAVSSRTVSRFIGRVFVRASDRGGHQLCQHYLDGMFPLARDPKTGALLRDPKTGVHVGCAETGNSFMESEIVIGADGDAGVDDREAMEMSWLGSGYDVEEVEQAVEVHDRSLNRRQSGQREMRAQSARVQVKDLSRLWKYRNGRSPAEKPPLLARDANGVIRTATM